MQISSQDYQYNFKQAHEKYEKNPNSNNNNGENSNQNPVVKFVNTPNSSNKPILINNNNGAAPGKGFISPKGESNSHLSSFKISSNSPQTNFIDNSKPTVMSLLEKKKNNIEGLNMNNIINSKNNSIEDNEKKLEKTSRLTSPKQMDAVIGMMDVKEKTTKPILKNSNNSSIYNAFHVKFNLF